MLRQPVSFNEASRGSWSRAGINIDVTLVYVSKRLSRKGKDARTCARVSVTAVFVRSK